MSACALCYSAYLKVSQAVLSASQMGTMIPWAAAGVAGREGRGGVRDTIQLVSPCFHMQHDTCHEELVFCIQAYSFPSGRATITTTNIPGRQSDCQEAILRSTHKAGVDLRIAKQNCSVRDRKSTRLNSS